MRIYTHSLITLAKLINNGSSDKPRKRGRPPKYSEEFINVSKEIFLSSFENGM